MKVVYKIRTKVDKEVVKRLKTHKQIYKVKRNKQGQTIVDVGKHDFYDFTNKRIKEYTVNIPTELQDKEPLVEYMEGFYKGYMYIVWF